MIDAAYLKSPVHILQQAEVAEILFRFFCRLKNPIPVGITGNYLQRVITEYLHTLHCRPAIRGYRGFAADISISKNEVLAHGIPSDDALKANDMVKIDLVSESNGWHADMAWTYTVGDTQEECTLLRNIAWQVCRKGVQTVKLGNTLNDIAHAVQEEASKHSVYVYNQFVGHGIGRAIHEPPKVRYDTKVEYTPIVPGMVLCIEPLIGFKHQAVKKLKDGSYVGQKGYKTAVFEHMVAMFASEARLLSYSLLPTYQMPEYPPV